MHDTHFYSLKIKEIIAETPEASTFVLDVPVEFAEVFKYEHGQYLTVRFQLNDKEVRRAYSICTSPVMDKNLAISVKRVNKGLVSTHMTTKLKAGDMIEVMAPQGRFTKALHHDHKKDYFLVGAGSGITPLISIGKSVLEVEPKSRVFLLYGNRNEESIMFKNELDNLSKRFAGQLVVKHVLSQPKTEKAGGLAGLFKKAKSTWDGATGRIDARKVSDFMLECVGNEIRETEFFFCGPVAMMDASEKMLLDKGLDHKHIHIERFINEGQAPKAPVAAGAVAGGKLTVTLGGKQIAVEPQGKETILDAVRRMGYDAPFSCLSGACATCMAKVTKGTVAMDACFALDDDEIAQGYCLACQAHPSAEEVELTFDI